MAEDYWAETDDVGTLVARHRVALGISLPDLLRSAHISKRGRLEVIEDTARPGVDDLEFHHTALMQAYLLHSRAGEITASRREQWWTTQHDLTLFHDVLTETPRTTWWWVIVSDKRGRGAWCNYCATLIHSYDAGSGVRRPARLAVMAHRAMHIADLAEAGATTTEGHAK